MSITDGVLTGIYVIEISGAFMFMAWIVVKIIKSVSGGDDE